jgi:PrgI family protein
MQATHKVPTHMSLPDKVVFGLTARQLLLLLIGCSLGYNLWLHLGVLEALALPGQVLRIVLALVPVGLAAALALISIADRPLEVWLLVLLRYWQRPRIYLWRSLRMSTQQQQHTRERERDRIPKPIEAFWSYA